MSVSGVSLEASKLLANFVPTGDALVCRFPQIVRRGKKDSSPRETAEVPRLVINQVIGIDDSFVTAKDDVACGNEREMRLEPTMLCRKRLRDFHGCRYDEY